MNANYVKVLEPILNMIESENLMPWQKSWNSVQSHPKNAVSGKSYQGGANRLILTLASMLHGGESRFIGWSQAKSIGASIRQGAKSVGIFVPIMKTVKNNIGDKEDKLLGFTLKRIFSVRDVVNLDESKIVSLPAPKHNHDPIKAAEDFMALQSPKIVQGPNPCYVPALDEVRMPALNEFKSTEAYYSTLYHEAIGHWSGHSARLNRKGIADLGRFGSPSYAEEELVAELTAAFGRFETGIVHEAEIADSAAYVKFWLGVLKESPQLLFKAAHEADRAIRFWKGEVKSENERQGLQEAA